MALLLQPGCLGVSKYKISALAEAGFFDSMCLRIQKTESTLASAPLEHRVSNPIIDLNSSSLPLNYQL
ncbi:hypothetical protein [Coleofasciculus chthonoplastes]|uniref:hypothetical protein n=1 Tax=Coleofasciculus chthonoplastes TaxID=64178 RepID=UPI0032FA20FD